ncbi:uncharacterized protein FOMMEDRAFT_152556 [Fomitiporia mediterranea MF3/22]|uniref:uncharacterized protein n=1 Tax=Fomitiporia mediterranea (strain MF3/22) TaxID=694068 RepID=UPI0004409868|nr:uncharacterized protein FOMMEDRAFT_152556 [Fomitiporia mediterranea MF3/22]EJD07179.1 hypothetical protein FOMMEDRAFT_152556 [Fomitiporia mediterranea MF3/22]
MFVDMDPTTPTATPTVLLDQQLQAELAQYVQTSIQEAFANHVPPAPLEPVLIVLEVTTCSRKKVHVACPLDFNGQHFKDFQCQVELYMAAALTDLSSDLNCVLFVLSFMKEGNAATWAQNWIEGHQIGSLIQLQNNESYLEFMGQLCASFINLNEKHNVQNKLVSL